VRAVWTPNASRRKEEKHLAKRRKDEEKGGRSTGADLEQYKGYNGIGPITGKTGSL